MLHSPNLSSTANSRSAPVYPNVGMDLWKFRRNQAKLSNNTASSDYVAVRRFSSTTKENGSVSNTIQEFKLKPFVGRNYNGYVRNINSDKAYVVLDQFPQFSGVLKTSSHLDKVDSLNEVLKHNQRVCVTVLKIEKDLKLVLELNFTETNKMKSKERWNRKASKSTFEINAETKFSPEYSLASSHYGPNALMHDTGYHDLYSACPTNNASYFLDQTPEKLCTKNEILKESKSFVDRLSLVLNSEILEIKSSFNSKLNKAQEQLNIECEKFIQTEVTNLAFKAQEQLDIQKNKFIQIEKALSDKLYESGKLSDEYFEEIKNLTHTIEEEKKKNALTNERIQLLEKENCTLNEDVTFWKEGLEEESALKVSREKEIEDLKNELKERKNQELEFLESINKQAAEIEYLKSKLEKKDKELEINQHQDKIRRFPICVPSFPPPNILCMQYQKSIFEKQIEIENLKSELLNLKICLNLKTEELEQYISRNSTPEVRMNTIRNHYVKNNDTWIHQPENYQGAKVDYETLKEELIFTYPNTKNANTTMQLYSRATSKQDIDFSIDQNAQNLSPIAENDLQNELQKIVKPDLIFEIEFNQNSHHSKQWGQTEDISNLNYLQNNKPEANESTVIIHRGFVSDICNKMRVDINKILNTARYNTNVDLILF